MRTMSFWSCLAMGVCGLGASAGCGDRGGPSLSQGVGTTVSELSAAQCEAFEANGTTTICHATSSTTNPYVLIKVSESACINAHAGHPRDFIDVSGGSCNNAACLPETAPCDPTLPCCGNLTCAGGSCTCPSGRTFCDVTCVDLTTDQSNCGACGNACAAGATCSRGLCSNPCVALDQCHSAGTADPATGVCSNPVLADGTSCDDGQACTHADQCTAGVCSGTPFTCTPGDCQTGGACNGDGRCTFSTAADGTTCSNGTCQAGACVAPTDSDCNGCMQSATTGACSAAVSACQGEPACTEITTCMNACADATCRQSCLSGRSTIAINRFQALDSCLSSNCNAQCGGTTPGGGGTSGGGAGGSTGSADGGSSVSPPGTCDGCTQQATGLGGSCASEVSTCQNDQICAALTTCIDGCAGDMVCTQNCTSAASAQAVAEYRSIASCVCSSCAVDCASNCGG